jgi:hypothetical protein
MSAADKHVRALRRDLVRARIPRRANGLARDLVVAYNRDLARVRAVDLDYALDLDHAVDSARAIHRAIDYVCGFGQFDRSADLALRRELDSARDLAHALGRDLNRCCLDSTLAAHHRRALDRANNRARVLARDLDRTCDRARARANGCGQPGARRVAPSARRLAVAAARLLPAPERARYDEEFRSELWEIAQAGGRRREQLAYAVRQLVAARPLRAGLRVPRRRGAAS